ncbi:MAG: tRNA adenosine(34) deaminase TadA [Pseudomonadota bacterium]
MDDLFYMKLALDEAKKAEQMDEVPVGAVLIDVDGQIAGTGFNQPIRLNDPTGHAEMLAIRMASLNLGNYRLPGATLYTTIEPCIMCMGAIIHARIARLVYGAADPKWGGAGSLYNFASDTRLNHRLDVVSGILGEDASEMIRSFFRNKRSRECQTQ